MKLLTKLLLALFVCTLCVSCAIHGGSMMNSASLTQNNFKIVGNVTGTAKTKYVLGFGGTKKDAMVLEAKQNMQSLYRLKPGQAYANITVDFKLSFWVVGATNKCTVNADVVQFLETNFNKADTSLIQVPNSGANTVIRLDSKNGYELAQRVYFHNENGESVEAIIVSLSEYDVELSYFDKNKKSQRIILPYAKITKYK